MTLRKFTTFFYTLLRPNRLMELSLKIRPYSGICALALSIVGLYGAFSAPIDSVQGQYARILYVHVPVSWGALAIYTWMALFSAFGLVTRIPQFFLLTKTIAPIGFVYCLISLITGSLWGKPTWGTFWVWDARLTSMFILGLLYMAYLYLSDTYALRRLVPSSFIVVLGAINIPIIKGSVEWWYTLHQPASIRLLERSSTIDWSMAWPLWVMGFALASYTIYLATFRLVGLLNSMVDGDA